MEWPGKQSPPARGNFRIIVPNGCEFPLSGLYSAVAVSSELIAVVFGPLAITVPLPRVKMKNDL